MSDKYIIEPAFTHPMWPAQNSATIEFLKTIISDNNGIIAGGLFKDILRRQGVKDIDMFFANEHDFTHAIDIFTNIGQKHFEETQEKNLQELYATDNSIGFGTEFNAYRNDIKQVIDCVRRFYGTPEEILETFDFTVTQCALYQDDNGEYVMMRHKDFYDDVKNHKLSYHDSYDGNGDNSIERFLRYSGYGFGNFSKDDFTLCVQNYSDFRHLDVDVEALMKAYGQEKVHTNLRELLMHNQENTVSRRVLVGKEWMFTNNNDRNILYPSFANNFSTSLKIDNYLREFNSGSLFSLKNKFHDLIVELTNKDVSDAKIAKTVHEITDAHYTFLKLNILQLMKDNLSIFSSQTIDEIVQFVFSDLVKDLNTDELYEDDNYINEPEVLASSVFVRKNEFKGSANLYVNNSFYADYVFYKTFNKKPDSEEWWSDCVQFFHDVYNILDNPEKHYSRIKSADLENPYPSMKQWSNFIDGDLFDPTMNAVLAVEVIKI